MLNHAEIALLLDEMEGWQGAAVQRVQQGATEELVLGLRKPGATRFLAFRMQRGHLRFHWEERRPAALEKPPAFSMALRKLLLGARLIGWTQPPGERIARFDFARGGEHVTLVAELVPPGGNLVLIDGEGRVLARLFNDGRNGTLGRKYVPPPAISGSQEAQSRAWSGESFHAFIAAQYAGTTDESARETEKRQIKKAATLARKLDQDLKRAGDPETWHKLADLLSAHPHAEPDVAGQLVLTDPETGERVQVPYDPQRTHGENVAALHKRARKAESARKHIAERRRILETEGTTVRRQERAAAPKAVELPPGHVFRYPGGSTIVAGRSAEENERITYGFARPEDHWLHARGVPGSHVVVRHAAADDLDALLDDAARLALHYSFKRGEPAGDVQWTRRKYVQRIKGAPGKVRLIQEANRRVETTAGDLARIEALRIRKAG